jgi:hypothetical protein
MSEAGVVRFFQALLQRRAELRKPPEDVNMMSWVGGPGVGIGV